MQRKHYLLLILLGMLSFSIFLLNEYLVVGELGFPLDDGWIHQTYARNFAQYAEWAYTPGIVSGGSTSPLWTLVLSLVQLTNTGPFWGTFFFSLICFLGAGIIFQKLTSSTELDGSLPGWFKGFPFFGAYFLVEWRMTWATVSGMEIIFYIAIILLFFLVLVKENHLWLSGMLAGIAFWIRPDGITLLGPLFFVILLGEQPINEKVRKAFGALSAFLPFLLLYFGFNKLTAGTWWPNTFYAKQTEYAILYQIPFLKRFLQLSFQPWISAGIVLLPGFIFQIIYALRKKNWKTIALFLWATGYVFVYAIRLPVVYQHARYLMPTMPVLYSLGLIGTIHLIEEVNIKASSQKMLRFGTFSLIIVLSFGFYLLGMNAYASDVAIIHEEMVETAKWVDQNIPVDEIVAAHDIGALGYFGGHDILDLAGLISPEVIPFIRDEERLLIYLQDNDVRYLMSLSDWYTTLFIGGEEIYRSDGTAVVNSGGQPMVVYRYNWEGK